MNVRPSIARAISLLAGCGVAAFVQVGTAAAGDRHSQRFPDRLFPGIPG
ncbi:MAG: hypothetical protein WBF89_17725 [Steroidobacteraceae bacterium]